MPRFDPCPPDSRTCVSSRNDGGYAGLDPVPFTCTPQEALQAVRDVVEGLPRTAVVQEDQGYLATTFTTPLLRFTDRVQFEVDAEARLVHFRSESVPYAGRDLGANRKRMKMVSELLRQRLG